MSKLTKNTDGIDRRKEEPCQKENCNGTRKAFYSQLSHGWKCNKCGEDFIRSGLI
jgi:hypothetical protein